MVATGKNVLELIIAARNRTHKAFIDVGRQMGTVKKHAGGLSGAMKSVQNSISSVSPAAGKLVTALGPLGIAGVAVLATAAIVGLGAAAVKSFAAFEDALANVRKTTGMSKDQIDELGSAIDEMALHIPVAHDELAKIAAVAGQLGIVGKENILAFTETAAKMATSFDMAGSEVAISIAKLANIYDIPIEQASNLGSAINVLGNTTAASEQQIMAFAMSLGPTGKQLGFAETETLALGASMISIGVEASNAGTRLNRAFSMIGQNLEELSHFMGVPAEEFKQSFEDMPMETFMEVLEKLSQVEGKLESNTIATKVFNEIGGKAIKSLTGDLDGLRRNLGNSATGYRENTSLTEEFAAKTDTLKAKFTLFGNQMESLKINIGGALAPLAGALTGVATTAVKGLSEGFNLLQKFAKPALDSILIGLHALKAFFDGFAGPVIAALSPLIEKLIEVKEKIMEGSGKLTLLNDIFVIVTGTAKWLGNVIGKLVAMALTPLIEKLKTGIDMLERFYNKLGPVKDALEWVTGKVGDLADSFKEAEPAAEELEEAVKDVGEAAKEMVPGLEASAKNVESMLRGTSGNYKKAIKEITDEIEKLEDAWNLASKEQKVAIEEEINVLRDLERELRDGEKVQEEYFSTTTKGAKEAAKVQKDFTIEIGKTKVTFSEMAGEAIKNASAYKDLAENAATLLALDWKLFTDLEAELPNIDKGIGNMESAFVGLKDILETNIDKLENVKQSVMDIADIAAPFLEAGFLDGIKAIGSFAGALKDAGSAINTFAGLQDVSIQGCIDFSMHVHDMVSALRILDTQMEDLVPSFGEMDSLITDIADSFVYSAGKGKDYQDAISLSVKNAIADLDSQGISVDSLLSKYTEYTTKGLASNDALSRSFFDLGVVSREGFEDFYDLLDELAGTKEGYGMADEFIAALEAGEDLNAWSDEYLHTSKVLSHQMDEQTNALWDQTTQLTKITKALEPYLEFMRTLNELAVLNTLSVTDLNNGFKSIEKTLINLSSALSGFDLASVMESLFGDEELEGSANAFMKTMEDSGHNISMLINYINNLSFAIKGLVDSFEALKDINKSVLADEIALKTLLEDIEDVMEHFSKAMDTEGFGDLLAKGLDKMVKSAAPLTKYFQDNNAAVTRFNSTILSFKTTLTNVISVMEMLQKVTKMTLPGVDELAAGFDKAADFVETLDKALLKHIGINKEARTVNMELYNAGIFETIKTFAADWGIIIASTTESFETLQAGINIIVGVIQSIKNLSEAFKGLEDIIVMSSEDMEEALSNVSGTIKQLELFLGTDTWTAITKNMGDFAAKWEKVNGDIIETVKTLTTFISVVSSITSNLKGLKTAMKDVGNIASIAEGEMEKAFSGIPDMLNQITLFLKSDVFKDIKTDLSDLSTEYKLHQKALEDTMPAFEDATTDLSTLATKVISLSEAFETLSEITIISSTDMGRAMDNINVFVVRFTEALRLNLDALIKSLTKLDTEWGIHAKEMEKVMPAYADATGSISGLIGPIVSLASALKSLAEMGTISSAKFDAGFGSLIESIGNFAVSMARNVEPLIASLKTLRVVWVENETVLVPLMQDFIIITKSFASIAINANIMINAFKEIAENSGSLEEGFKTLIKFIKDVVENTKEFYTPEAAEELSRFIGDVEKVIDSFADLDERIGNAIREIENKITDSVSDIERSLLDLENLDASMYHSGQNLMTSFIDGIVSLQGELEAELIEVADLIEGYLKVASPAKLGPLRSIMTWPKNLMKTFSEGIAGEMGTLNRSFAGMVSPITTGVGGGSGNHTNVVVSITQNIKNRSDADYSAREIERLLSKHQVL